MHTFVGPEHVAPPVLDYQRLLRAGGDDEEEPVVHVEGEGGPLGVLDGAGLVNVDVVQVGGRAQWNSLTLGKIPARNGYIRNSD